MSFGVRYAYRHLPVLVALPCRYPKGVLQGNGSPLRIHKWPPGGPSMRRFFFTVQEL